MAVHCVRDFAGLWLNRFVTPLLRTPAMTDATAKAESKAAATETKETEEYKVCTLARDEPVAGRAQTCPLCLFVSRSIPPPSALTSRSA